MKRVTFQRFLDFGAELRRPFEVHANCYNCAELYKGCNAWRASKEFRCADFLKLPDVMPGDNHRQVFPSSRMNGRKVPRELPSETTKPEQTEAAKGRQCVCGQPLPKRRRLCDGCRAGRRRASMADYMKKRRVELMGTAQSLTCHRIPQKASIAGRRRLTRANPTHGPPCQLTV